jgi:hypothetical protein
MNETWKYNALAGRLPFVIKHSKRHNAAWSRQTAGDVLCICPAAFAAGGADERKCLEWGDRGFLKFVIGLAGRRRRQDRPRHRRCQRLPRGSYSKHRSSVTPSAIATLNAVSREGEYLSCSMAMTVWRVTPTRSASSCWVISREARSSRIRLRMAGIRAASGKPESARRSS